MTVIELLPNKASLSVTDVSVDYYNNIQMPIYYVRKYKSVDCRIWSSIRFEVKARDHE